MNLRARLMARDYNRGLLRPIRAGRWCAGVAGPVVGPVWGWVGAPLRRQWALPLAVGAVGFVLLVPFDGPLAEWMRTSHVGGDIRRELHAWQQFGAFGSLLFTVAVICVLDPARRRRLFDLGAAVAINALAMTVMKMLVGRPRPRPAFSDPTTFLGPWRRYPVIGPGGETRLLYAWEPAAVRSADLWSMPSSHAAAAAVLAVFLSLLYPRLTWVMMVLMVTVGVCRVIFGAHWPTDVVVGTAVGLAVGRVAVGRYWGIRAMDWLWVRLVDRDAVPSLGWVQEAERRDTRRLGV